MAEEKVESRELTWWQLLPWTYLFRGFQIALDPNKLFLAALGIMVMTLGWLFLAFLFSLGYSKPAMPASAQDRPKVFAEVKERLKHYDLMHEAANTGGPNEVYQPIDVADTLPEYDVLVSQYGAAKDSEDRFDRAKFAANIKDYLNTPPKKDATDSELRLRANLAANAPRYIEKLGEPKEGGYLATWPFFEKRGPNPVLLILGRAKAWEHHGILNWLVTEQAPVLVEPLLKMLRPIAYLFSPRADPWTRFYFFLVTVFTLAVWSLFGGAITRIAAVQIARGEKISAFEAFSFTRKRLLSYLTAPLFPLLLVAFLLIFMIIYGFFFMVPLFGDIIVAGLGWWLMILFGLGIAVALVGLVGWPLMAATVSTEGTDSWEAFSRSYSYVFQRPWHYLWYAILTIIYGAIVVFFIGFMGSFVVYLSKFGVSRTPWIESAGREPSFLFVYAPTSFGWRELLLSDAKYKMGNDGPVERVVDEDGHIKPRNYEEYRDTYLNWYNRVGAVMVNFWVYILFLFVLGFGYSFFWSSMTISYMLLRKSVDKAEMDEVYLEEDDQDTPYSGPMTTPPATPMPPPAKPTNMVDAPTLKTPVVTAEKPIEPVPLDKPSTTTTDSLDFPSKPS